MSQPETPTPESTPAAREPFRWRQLLQYKLRTLLFVVIPLCAAFFAWWSYRAHQQRTAVAALWQAGADVSYDFEEQKLAGPAHWPNWLVQAIGVDYFANVHVVDFSERKPAYANRRGSSATTGINRTFCHCNTRRITG